VTAGVTSSTACGGISLLIDIFALSEKIMFELSAGVTQLVESLVANEIVAGSSPVSRSYSPVESLPLPGFIL
jgi:hypothetical protein